MIVEEESAGDVEGHKDVDAVVLVRRQDKEHTKAVEQPSEGVKEVDSATRVLRDEEIQQGQRHRVSREHVVSTCPDFQMSTCNNDENGRLTHLTPWRDIPAPDQMI